MKAAKVAIYARVSTDDKGQDVTVQLERCRKFCEAMGWEATKFIDHESAYRVKGKERPQFARVMEAIRTHQLQGVVVYQMDRFSKEDPLRVSAYLQQIVHDHGAVFVSITDGVDSRNEAFPIIERVMAWQANNWSRAHSQRVKAGIARARAKRPSGGWGRRPITELRGEPELASKARQMRLQGASWGGIAKRLGIGRTTARRLCQKAQGKRMGVSGTFRPPLSDSDSERPPLFTENCSEKRSNGHTGGDEQ